MSWTNFCFNPEYSCTVAVLFAHVHSTDIQVEQDALFSTYCFLSLTSLAHFYTHTVFLSITARFLSQCLFCLSYLRKAEKK